MPDPDCDPTCRELIDHNLAPIAARPAIARHLRFDARIVSVTRQGMDRVPSAGREQRPFEIVTVGPDGEETRHLARVVIDASGTWSTPNPAGSAGVPAQREDTAVSRISYGTPDTFGAKRARFAGRRVMVIGPGHSAMDSILGLARLRSEEPATEVLWAMRWQPTERTFGDDDQLAGRGALGERSKDAVDDGTVTLCCAVSSEALRAFWRYGRGDGREEERRPDPRGG